GILQLFGKRVRVRHRLIARVTATYVRGRLVVDERSAVQELDDVLVPRRTTCKHERGKVLRSDCALQCVELRILTRTDECYFDGTVQLHVRAAEQVPERRRKSKHRLGEGLEDKNRASAVFGVVPELGQLQQQIDRQRGPRRNGVVSDVARARYQLLGVTGGVEESADFIIPNPLDHGVG